MFMSQRKSPGHVQHFIQVAPLGSGLGAAQNGAAGGAGRPAGAAVSVCWDSMGFPWENLGKDMGKIYGDMGNDIWEYIIWRLNNG